MTSLQRKTGKRISSLTLSCRCIGQQFTIAVSGQFTSDLCTTDAFLLETVSVIR